MGSVFLFKYFAHSSELRRDQESAISVLRGWCHHPLRSIWIVDSESRSFLTVQNDGVLVALRV
jgi:hypothetical protein